jgi:hypothetical protein
LITFSAKKDTETWRLSSAAPEIRQLTTKI